MADPSGLLTDLVYEAGHNGSPQYLGQILRQLVHLQYGGMQFVVDLRTCACPRTAQNRIQAALVQYTWREFAQRFSFQSESQ